MPNHSLLKTVRKRRLLLRSVCALLVVSCSLQELSFADPDLLKPIEWNKVHVMPDHVRFNHKRHVTAGVSCQECHGQIPEMEKVERVSSMKMGWCISCHRERGTSIDCWTCHK